MTNEQLQAASREDPPLSDRPGRGRAIYNLSGVEAELKFAGPVLADIFLGKITKWSDPAIARDNPGVSLPDADINVVTARTDRGPPTSSVTTCRRSRPSTGRRSAWPPR